MKEQIIKHILAQADGILGIVEDYDEDNIELFLRIPDAVLQKMAAVLTDAYRHLDQHLSVYQNEFEKFETTYD